MEVVDLSKATFISSNHHTVRQVHPDSLTLFSIESPNRIYPNTVLFGVDSLSLSLSLSIQQTLIFPSGSITPSAEGYLANVHKWQVIHVNQQSSLRKVLHQGTPVATTLETSNATSASN
ncbi:hypothetical protein L6452_44397 [Arctium lappa]|uniref:Uncharacterized protein n=1 Tax=Arctium lappa TaxID=4217 RepID=A0ACB8XFS3_ARCLA|nr:hypothetical protein L6452_44397 [Arctium lappa]